jgi:nitrogenase molybdenum-iron protein alpha chain
MGYRGIFELATRIERVLENPKYFTTLGKTAKQPYKDSWYEADPFTYIRQAELQEVEQ